ncbi:MAG: hypothetical protein ABIE55_04395 [Candidatus Aenigmatarchaeota archaeon]
MKGIELPINVLVIIVIAVIVLLGVIAVYFTGWTPFAETAGVDAVKNAGCRMVVYDCSSIDLTNILFDGSKAGLPKYDVNDDGYFCPADTANCASRANDNMVNLCSIYFDTDATGCAKLCGCT